MQKLLKKLTKNLRIQILENGAKKNWKNKVQKLGKTFFEKSP